MNYSVSNTYLLMSLYHNGKVFLSIVVCLMQVITVLEMGTLVNVIEYKLAVCGLP